MADTISENPISFLLLADLEWMMPESERNPLVILSLEPVPSATEASGAAVHIRSLLTCLARQGNEVHVLATSPGEESSLVAHDVGSGKNLVLRYARQMAVLLGIRVTRNPDILYTRTSLNAAVGMIAFAMRKRAAMVCEINGFAEEEWRHRDSGSARRDSPASSMLRLINRRSVLWAERWAISRADRIVTVTEGIRRMLVAEHGIDEDRVTVIENGADTDLFTPADRENACRDTRLPPTSPYICYVGTFMPWHALPVIIEAMSSVLVSVPDARLLLVGDGDARTTAEGQARTLGIADSVIFTGRVPHDRVPILIAASRVCLATFTTERNSEIGLSPLKIYEYLACGRPVIATDIEGVTEVIDASGGGYTVPPDDPDALAAVILALLHDPELADGMGRSGRAWVVRNRSWAAAAAEMVEVMHEARARHR